MTKTTQVAADRAKDQAITVLPLQHAQALYIRNVPSLRGLKLMHLMIAVAGSEMAADIYHKIRLGDLRKTEGMGHHTKETLRTVFEELRAMVITYDNKDEKRYKVGGFLDEADVDYIHEVAGDTIVACYFGKTFRDMASISEQWALVDRHVVYHLKSRYSVLLFQYISSLVGLDHIHSKEIPISELRSILGVTEGKLKTHSNLKIRALEPAIEEINELSRYNLTATTVKLGRVVTGVEISWELKPEPKPAKKATASPLKSISPNGDVTPATPAKAFPKAGSIEFSKPWNMIAKREGNGKDKDLIAQDFRNWCQTRNIKLDGPTIEKAFTTFCKNVKPV